MFDLIEPIPDKKFCGLSFVGITITVSTIEYTGNSTGTLKIIQSLKFSDLCDLLDGSKIVVNDSETRKAVVKYVKQGNCLVIRSEETLTKLPQLIESLQGETLVCTDDKSNRIASNAIVQWTEKQLVTGDYQSLMNAFHVARCPSWGW